MIRSIGFRCSPHKVFYCIIEKRGYTKSILNIDSLTLPSCLIVPEQLKYIRNNILDILNEYQVICGGIRVAEPTSRTLAKGRLYLEGVIQELFASSSLMDYYIGQIANISRYLGMERSDFKKYINNKKHYQSIENWNSLRKEEKESALTALGAFEIVSNIR